MILAEKEKIMANKKAKFNLNVRKSTKGNIEATMKGIEKYFEIPKVVKNLDWKYIEADEKNGTAELIYLEHAFDVTDNSNLALLADTFCGFGSEEALGVYEKELDKVKIDPVTMYTYLVSVYVSDELRAVKELPASPTDKQKEQHVLDTNAANLRGWIRATADLHVWINKLQK